MKTIKPRKITLSKEELSLIGRPYKSRVKNARRITIVILGFVAVNLIAILLWVK